MFVACLGRCLIIKHLICRCRPSVPNDDMPTAPQEEEEEARNQLCLADVQLPSHQDRSQGRDNEVRFHPNSYEGARDPAVAATSTAALSLRTGLNAYRIQEMQAENVTLCDARNIMDGLCLQQRELGRGTFGIVVSGIYRGVKCAVKVMLSPGLDRAAIRELLLSPSLVHPNVVSTYASRCAKLTHEFFDLLEGDRAVVHDPNLPRVLEPVPLQSEDGFGDPKGLHDGSDPLIVLHQILHALRAETGKMVVIVVQEYCDRGTLDNAIRKSVFRPTLMWGMRLARRALLRSAVEIARGLLHLHDSGVVHGDLKPANVLLGSSKEDRRGFVVKVADFGLAHLLPSDANSLYTDSWGSVAYMAPEAFRGRVSRATDVWAFGVCLWQMLTGEKPYNGYRHMDVVIGVQESTLELKWPEGTPMASRIIELGRRCLSHNTQDRPALDIIIQTLVDIEREIRAELLAHQQQQQQQQGGRQEQQEPHQRAANTSTITVADASMDLPAGNFISDLVVM
ncbi:hypothetical protein VaNZ11_010967 [Volvox africanus]|uniref:Protein kinase domain-containing protein n=1 Tax=Volvox africanus TaxID=51714 RepID=A0ABQ5SBT8_9CHLO|nr:hypothetical protein VaNZ11_010967 [Volvox africanus]